MRKRDLNLIDISPLKSRRRALRNNCVECDIGIELDGAPGSPVNSIQESGVAHPGRKIADSQSPIANLEHPFAMIAIDIA